MGSLFFIIFVLVCIVLVIIAICALVAFVFGLLSLGFLIAARIRKKKNIRTNLSKVSVVCFIVFLLSSAIPVAFLLFMRTMGRPVDYVDTGNVIQVSQEAVDEGHEFEYEGETLVPIEDDGGFMIPDEAQKKAVCNLSTGEAGAIYAWICGMNGDLTLYDVQNESEYPLYWVDGDISFWCRKRDQEALLEYYKFTAPKVFKYRDRELINEDEEEWPDSSEEAGILNELARYEHSMEVAKKKVWESDVVSAWTISGHSTDGLWSDGWVIVATEDGIYEAVSGFTDEWVDEDGEPVERDGEAGVELSDELEAYLRKILIQ